MVDESTARVVGRSGHLALISVFDIVFTVRLLSMRMDFDLDHV